MAITYVGVGAENYGSNAITAYLPTGTQAGDLLLVTVETANQTIATPTGYTEVTNSPQSTGTAAATGGIRLGVFWKIHTGTESDVSIADSGDHQVAFVTAYRGVDNTAPIEASVGSVQATATTSLVWPSVTTLSADTMVVLVCGQDWDQNSAASSGILTNDNLTVLRERIDRTVSTGWGGGIVLLTGFKATAGAIGTTTSTTTASLAHVYISMSLKPASVGGITEGDGASSGAATGLGQSALRFVGAGTSSGTVTVSSLAALRFLSTGSSVSSSTVLGDTSILPEGVGASSGAASASGESAYVSVSLGGSTSASTVSGQGQIVSTTAVTKTFIGTDGVDAVTNDASLSYILNTPTNFTALKILSNRLAAANDLGDRQSIYINNVAFGPRQRCEVLVGVAPDASDYVMLLVRCDGTYDNYIQFLISNGLAILRGYNGGVFFSVAELYPSIASNDVVALEIDQAGTSVSITKNGVHLGASPYTVSGMPTGTRIGAGFYASSTTEPARITSFTGDDFGTTSVAIVEGTGSVACAASASGLTASLVTASGSVACAASASGLTASLVTASGSVACAVSASGLTASLVTASGSVACAVSASGLAAYRVTVSGSVACAASASGLAAYRVTVSGSVACAASASGLAAYRVTVSGSVACAVSVLGSSGGSTIVESTCISIGVSSVQAISGWIASVVSTVTGASSVSGSTGVVRSTSSTITGIASTSAISGMIASVSGSSVGQATVLGEVPELGNIQSADGDSAGTTTVSGSGRIISMSSGAIVSAATINGFTAQYAAVSGSITSSASVIAAAAYRRAVSGASSGSGAVTGSTQLRVWISCEGQSQGVCEALGESSFRAWIEAIGSCSGAGQADGLSASAAVVDTARFFAFF